MKTLTRGQVIDRLGIHPHTFHKLVRRGDLPQPGQTVTGKAVWFEADVALCADRMAARPRAMRVVRSETEAAPRSARERKAAAQAALAFGEGSPLAAYDALCRAKTG